MGSIDACKGLSNLPLWYAHYDGKSSFSDYIKISDWSSPFMKQYAGDQTKCNVGVDLNYIEWLMNNSDIYEIEKDEINYLYL